MEGLRGTGGLSSATQGVQSAMLGACAGHPGALGTPRAVLCEVLDRPTLRCAPGTRTKWWRLPTVAGKDWALTQGDQPRQKRLWAPADAGSLIVDSTRRWPHWAVSAQSLELPEFHAGRQPCAARTHRRFWR